MGYDVQLVLKTQDEEVEYRIFECTEERQVESLSRDFAMFVSRKTDGSEFDQVQKILGIDISPYRRFPKNYQLDTGELEYLLYKAEQNNDSKRVSEIKAEIDQKRIDWENSYYVDNEGWSTVEEYTSITSQFIREVQRNSEKLQAVTSPKGWDYDWGDYFHVKDEKNRKNSLLFDLKQLLAELECVRKHNVTYVAIFGA